LANLSFFPPIEGQESMGQYCSIGIIAYNIVDITSGMKTCLKAHTILCPSANAMS
jgi:hypothetical protein